MSVLPASLFGRLVTASLLAIGVTLLVVVALLLSERRDSLFVGSDAAAIRTRATRTDGGWRIDGAKQFITSGRTADMALVFAVTDPASSRTDEPPAAAEPPARPQQPQNNLRSTTSPRSVARSTSTHVMPRLSASTRACGLMRSATNMPVVGAKRLSPRSAWASSWNARWNRRCASRSKTS